MYLFNTHHQKNEEYEETSLSFKEVCDKISILHCTFSELSLNLVLVKQFGEF